MKRIYLIMAMAFLLCGCQNKAPTRQLSQQPFKTTTDEQTSQQPYESETEEQTSQQPFESETEEQDAQQSDLESESIPETKEVETQTDSSDMIEIKEKMFVAQTNDVYFNTADYLGKTFKYEGIFCRYDDVETGKTYYSVIRYGPGCCGVDANAGFEVKWDGDMEYPKQDDWVEAVGVLEEYEENGDSYLRLDLISLKVLETRGAEYVSQ